MSEDDAFLKRWSRRKSGATTQSAQPASQRMTQRMTWAFPDAAPETAEAAEELPAAPPEEALPVAPEEASAEETATAAETPAADSGDSPTTAEIEAKLPEVESLDYDSDYTGFMAEGVSDALRRRALRQLWRSNPILANVDGLNDYDEDFTDAALVKSGMKTAFDAVRGYLRDEEELEGEKAPQVDDAPLASEGESSETTLAGAEEDPSTASEDESLVEEADEPIDGEKATADCGEKADTPDPTAKS